MNVNNFVNKLLFNFSERVQRWLILAWVGARTCKTAQSEGADLEGDPPLLLQSCGQGYHPGPAAGCLEKNGLASKGEESPDCEGETDFAVS